MLKNNIYILLVSEINGTVEPDQSNIIVQISWIVFRMNENRVDVLLNMWVEFRLSVNIPFAQTNPQITRSVSIVKKKIGNLIK